MVVIATIKLKLSCIIPETIHFLTAGQSLIATMDKSRLCVQGCHTQKILILNAENALMVHFLISRITIHVNNVRCVWTRRCFWIAPPVETLCAPTGAFQVNSISVSLISGAIHALSAVELTMGTLNHTAYHYVLVKLLERKGHYIVKCDLHNDVTNCP